MSTQLMELTDDFLHLVEKDIDFFRYFELNDTEALALAKARAAKLLDEATSRIMMYTNPSVDLNARDPITGDITVSLNYQEKEIIPSVMYEIYLERDFAFLKALNVNYTRTDLRVFDPSNARSTFLEIYDKVKTRNAEYLDLYKNTDRATGQFRKIDFGSFDED